MVLNQTLKAQLNQYLQLLDQEVILTASLGTDQASTEVQEFLNEVVGLSAKLSLVTAKLPRTPSFTLSTAKAPQGRITFAGVPLGHEFESFVLALLQVSGHEPKISAAVKQQIMAIDQDLHFETYASLTCTNCPDVVQALNIMSVLNPKISHTMIEGGMYQEEVTAKNILAVPTVYLNGAEWASGRMTVAEIVQKLASKEVVFHVASADAIAYDVLVVGGGPAAATAAIYAVRKGLTVGLVAERFGGQPLETLGIENFIGTPYIEGEQLMKNVRVHVEKYPIHLIEGFQATGLQKLGDKQFQLTLSSGDQLQSQSVVIATGAHWRELGIPGEAALKTKGVAYCPHCDGPLYRDKDVAVIGGGNSGVEAAIDLAGTSRQVTLIEFMPKLAADEVLQQKLDSLKNVTVVTNAATQQINGTNQVTGLTYQDRTSGQEQTVDLAGVFVQVGLLPNTDWLGDTIALSAHHEIEVDDHNATNVAGVFAAGDCTTVPYKQIAIAIGAGATASLSAFDYLIRH
ncbi:alkyl hydroperoxide reductase subunit F [Lapidilactobacillus wuchangensis]|uniref:alkyl hydroperoxide reductase subunit F n=1 Tax=Lapidilactobacillus wuchangensis TaxID=2486001 RepID=UPI000F78D76D|nr:alkyl hydroperoxide reductase subunit F [Lapidilactobacillus wuchangensis]